jgi:acyl-CoA synthetase (AMP-forming)/AMP-acid ligase II
MWRMPETIPELLARNVTDFPDREAFVSVSHRTGAWVRHTWREMDQISERLAAGLAGIGVQKGRKVAFMHTNSAECYYAYLAVHKLGALFVPINVRLVAREVAFILEHSEAEFLIIGSDLTPLLDQMPAARRGMQATVCIEKEGDPPPEGTLSFARLTEAPEALPAVELSPDDEADLLYTTGTTGRPKGVILTQANKLACGRMLGATWGLQRKHYSCARAQNAFNTTLAPGRRMRFPSSPPPASARS